MKHPKTVLLSLGIAALATLGLFWQPYDPNGIDLDTVLAPMNFTHWLGTDHLGRDVLSRMMVGAARTLMVAGISLSVGLTIGVAVGLFAATAGQALGRVVMDMLGVFSVIPTLILAIALTAIFGLTPATAGISLAFSVIVQYGLFTHGLAQQIIREPYWLAAHALGGSLPRSVFTHIIPGIREKLLTHIGAEAGRIIVSYSALAFIGLGADTSAPDWGSMVWEYRLYLFEAPRLILAPIAAIALTCLSLHLHADTET